MNIQFFKVYSQHEARLLATRLYSPSSLKNATWDGNILLGGSQNDILAVLQDETLTLMKTPKVNKKTLDEIHISHQNHTILNQNSLSAPPKIRSQIAGQHESPPLLNDSSSKPQTTKQKKSITSAGASSLELTYDRQVAFSNIEQLHKFAHEQGFRHTTVTTIQYNTWKNSTLTSIQPKCPGHQKVKSP